MPLVAFRVPEDSGFWVIGRVMKVTSDYNRVPALQADFATIKRAVWNEDTDSSVLAQSSLTIADVVIDAMSFGDIREVLKKPDKGFNFVDKIPSTACPSDATYSIEYEFTSSSALGSLVRTESVRVVADKLWSQ